MNEEVSDIFGGSDDSDGEDSDHDEDMDTDLDSETCRQQLLSKRPRTCGVMAFHNGTEEALFLYVQRNALRGDPVSVLKAIDVFCYSRHWMMHCGDRKVQFLVRALSLRRELRSRDSSRTGNLKNVPEGTSGLKCLEIGSYCGYSAIKIASTFSSSGTDFLYCIEYDAKCVLFTQRMVAFAGLSHRVKVIHGSVGASEALFGSNGLGMKKMLRDLGSDSRVQGDLGSDSFDIVFIDHDKARYLEDLKVIEACGMLESGSVVVADNVLSFGQPLTAYLQHVRDNSESSLYSSSEINMCYLEYSNSRDYEGGVGDRGGGEGRGGGVGRGGGGGSEEGGRGGEGGEGEEVDGIEISIYR